MPRYTAPMIQGTIATTYKSLGVLLQPASSRRVSIYELDMGMSGALNTGNDTQVLFDVSRFTTTSIVAGTQFTPNPLDLADTVATTVSYLNAISAELTAITANSSLLNPPLNQRGTFRWRALDDGDNLIIPATTQAGIVVRALSLSYTGTAQGTVFYVE